MFYLIQGLAQTANRYRSAVRSRIKISVNLFGILYIEIKSNIFTFFTSSFSHSFVVLHSIVCMHIALYFSRYPLDAKVEHSPRAKQFTTADDDILRELALTYSEHYPDMHSGRGCILQAPTQFPSGITNGAAWRELSYSLQDFAYLDLNVLAISPHIHCCHYVEESELPKLYKNNEKSLLALLEKARQAVKGDIADKLHTPLRNSYITVHGRNTIINVTKDYGSFYRLLPQGRYKLIAHAHGHSSIIKDVTVGPEVKDAVTFSLNKFVADYKYHDPDEVEELLGSLSPHCSDVMRLYTIGKTASGRPIQVVELSDNPGRFCSF